MMESNPKLRAKTYRSIRDLKVVRDKFKNLYKETGDDSYSSISHELNKTLRRCLDLWCEDAEDLDACNCLSESGFDAEWMNITDLFGN